MGCVSMNEYEDPIQEFFGLLKKVQLHLMTRSLRLKEFLYDMDNFDLVREVIRSLSDLLESFTDEKLGTDYDIDSLQMLFRPHWRKYLTENEVKKL